MANKTATHGIELNIDEGTDPGQRPEAVFTLKNASGDSWSLAKIVGIGDGSFGGKLAIEINAGGEKPTEKTVERLTIDHAGDIGIKGSLTVGGALKAGAIDDVAAEITTLKKRAFTAKDVGALPIGGGTLTGDLTVTGKIDAGKLMIGTYPRNSTYVFFGANTLDQKEEGNYALAQNATKGSGGNTLLNSPVDIKFKIKNKDKMIIDKDGNVEVLGSLTVRKQENWKDVNTLQNGWKRYNNEYNTAGYFKDSMGIVHLRGMVKSGTIGRDVPMFKLPERYRPNLRELHVARTDGKGTARVDIDPNGQVSVVEATTNAWVSLYGISFRTAD